MWFNLVSKSQWLTVKFRIYSNHLSARHKHFCSFLDFLQLRPLQNTISNTLLHYLLSLTILRNSTLTLNPFLKKLLRRQKINISPRQRNPLRLLRLFPLRLRFRLRSWMGSMCVCFNFDVERSKAKEWLFKHTMSKFFWMNEWKSLWDAWAYRQLLSLSVTRPFCRNLCYYLLGLERRVKTLIIWNCLSLAPLVHSRCVFIPQWR